MKSNEQSLQASDIGMNLLQPFSVLSHPIKDANTLECFLGPAPPRSQVHHLVENGNGRQCTLMAVSTKPNKVGRSGFLKGNPGGGMRKRVNRCRAGAANSGLPYSTAVPSPKILVFQRFL